MEKIKIAIVGSRTFNDYEMLKTFIGQTFENESELFQGKEVEVISGGARGADKLGEQFAKEKGYGLTVFKAEWDKYGKSAGFRRNVDIIKNCDICFAFWDGESHGTQHDIQLCEEYNKRCFICRFDLVSYFSKKK